MIHVDEATLLVLEWVFRAIVAMGVLACAVYLLIGCLYPEPDDGEESEHDF